MSVHIKLLILILTQSMLISSCDTSQPMTSNEMSVDNYRQLDFSLDHALPLDAHNEELNTYSMDQGILRSSGSLVHAFEWQVVELNQDPFQSFTPIHSPMDVTCDAEAHGVEEVSVGVWSYSIETDLCHWLTIGQPIIRPIQTGDVLQLKVWHFDLNATQRALAHVGVATKNEILIMEEEVIPQEARMIKAEATFTHDLQVGDWIYFHLDNHGANSWHLLEIELLIVEKSQ